MVKYDLGAFVEPLCLWYKENKRRMPWRDCGDAYRIWISEIMLQQTRIEAVMGYYDRFLKRLPTVGDLAVVEEDELLKLWEGLGYYNRARNLQKAAKEIVARYDSELPRDYEALKKLPGIGNYTAGAIASMAYSISAPAVDGNVMRVTMRLLGCYDDIMKAGNRAEMERSLLQVMPPDMPGEFNQAWMELGEVICVPNGAPHCQQCPLATLCEAKQKGIQMELPVKPVKKQRRIEKKTILLIEKGGMIGIQKRPDQGLLASMWELPGLSGHKQIKTLQKELQCEKIQSLGSAKHIFSHVEWHMKGHHVVVGEEDCVEIQKIFPSLIYVKKADLQQKYALPVAFHPFLQA